MVDPDDYQKWLDSLPKIDPEKVKEAVAEYERNKPKHDGFKIKVGGIRPSCPDHPDYWRGVREVWSCSKDCPACKSKRKDL